ncbi:NDP-hexose 2,3-dehydratase family protein [Flagellimonas marinaquae]
MSNHIQKNSVSSKFLKSAYATISNGMTDEDVLGWLKAQNEAVEVRVHHTSFSRLDKWGYDQQRQCIRHDTGRFFSIEGIHVRTNWGYKSEWEQPIINQPEVGFLGCLVKEFDGILHFLMQAKIEPGNLNKVQLSPTLQATRSNFSRVHNGRTPAYLSFFQHAKPHQILLDQLQSEQGARFLKKRNRNIVVNVAGDIKPAPNFIWLTLGQIKSLMKYDHVVNMDTRTVIAGLPYGNYEKEVVSLFNHLNEGRPNTARHDFLTSTLTGEGSLHSIDEIISKITHLKSQYELEITQADLKSLDEWVYSDTEIYHRDRNFFRVIPVEVEIGNREVRSWYQPMIQPAQEGLCALVCRRINGLLHVAMQLKMECGNHDVVELAPTVQTLTGNYKSSRPGGVPFLDYVLNVPKEQVVFDTMQSEEGGRFFEEQNRNMIIIVPDEPAQDAEQDSMATLPYYEALYGQLPEKFVWMTLNQLGMFLKFNNYLNIQARSLIAAISF